MERVQTLARDAGFLRAEAETLHQAGNYAAAITRLLRSPRHALNPASIVLHSSRPAFALDEAACICWRSAGHGVITESRGRSVRAVA